MCPCFLPSVVSWLVHSGQLPGAEMLPAHRHPREVGGNEDNGWFKGKTVVVNYWLHEVSVSPFAYKSRKCSPFYAEDII